jgi:hypothetical protein
MTNYIFLTENFNEGPTTYYAISADKIETLNLFETYDQHGQKVGHTNAGDYHLDNSDGTYAMQDCIKAINEKFGIGLNDVDVTIIKNGEEFEVDHNDMGWNESEVNDFIKEWRKENESLTEVEGFTYWDGRNWKTITTSVDDGEPSHEVVSDEKLVAELHDAIENKSFEVSGFGCDVYSHDQWAVIDSNWQGTWASYEIMSMIDYEYRAHNSSALPAIH